jgi:hypothetical protein
MTTTADMMSTSSSTGPLSPAVCQQPVTGSYSKLDSWLPRGSSPTPGTVLFYGRKDKYWVLSNFYADAPFYLDGEHWASTEHFYQVKKDPNASPVWFNVSHRHKSFPWAAVLETCYVSKRHLANANAEPIPCVTRCAQTGTRSRRR